MPIFGFFGGNFSWLAKRGSRLAARGSGSQARKIASPWLCLSNRKAECSWSHSFLLADFAGTASWSFLFALRSFGVNHFLGSAKYFDSIESFLLHSAMMDSKILPLKLSCMDFPRIRVRLLLFTEYAI